MSKNLNSLFRISNNILNNNPNNEVLHAVSFINNIKIDQNSYLKNDIIINKLFFLLFVKNLFKNFLKFNLRLLIFLFNIRKDDIIKKKYLFINTFYKYSNKDIYYRSFFKLKEIKKDATNVFIKSSLFKKYNTARILLPSRNLSNFEELQIAFLLLKSFFLLLKKYFNTKNYYEKKVLLYTGSEIFSGDTHNTLRLVKSLKKLVIKNNIKKIVTLFEGHGYERLIYRYLKGIKSCETIAYQQTGLSKHQNILVNLKNKDFHPNKIFVVNERDKFVLKNRFQNSKIYNIGKNNINNHFKKWKKFNKKIIVILSANKHEILETINLISASGKNKFRFIIRFHPNSLNDLNIKKFVEKKLKLNKINFLFSKQKMSKDLSNCSIGIISSGSSLIDLIEYAVFPVVLKFKNIIDTPANFAPKLFKFLKNKQDFIYFLDNIDYFLNNYNYMKLNKFSEKFFNKLNLKNLNKNF